MSFVWDCGCLLNGGPVGRVFGMGLASVFGMISEYVWGDGLRWDGMMVWLGGVRACLIPWGFVSGRSWGASGFLMMS